MKVNGDFSGATRFNHMMMNLEKQFTSDRHLSNAADAAMSILTRQFGLETDLMAQGEDEDGHPTGRLAHVYEYGREGYPDGRLWSIMQDGYGGERTISWDWLPAYRETPLIESDYPDDDDFDFERLRGGHVFVWKAPVMEYGTTVTVARKRSWWLVIPYPDDYNGLGDGEYVDDGYRSVLFTKHSYEFSPGEMHDSTGRFTAWFASWWGGQAENILDEMFEPSRDNRFRRAFLDKTRDGRKTKKSTKTLSWGYDTAAAAEGARDAIEITREVEQEYLRIARTR